MKKLALFCMVAVGAWAIAAPLSAPTQKYLTNAWTGNTTVTVPEAKVIPDIDGKAGDAEWRDAIKICGFSTKNRLVPERSGYVALKKDGKYLYCLVRTTAKNNDPGGGLTTRANGRDSAVFDDDSIEFIFSGGGANDPVWHLIFNDNCALYDRKVVVSPKSIDSKWNIQDYAAQSVAESGWWTFEVKFALAEIGARRNGLKFNIARNWSGYGPSTLNDTSRHIDLSRALNGIFVTNGPVVRMGEITGAASGEWDIDMSADNPTGGELVMGVLMREYFYPRINGKVQRQIKTVFAEETVIPPGKQAGISKKYSANRNIHHLSMVLYDRRSKRVYYNRIVSGKKEIFTGRRPVSGTFNIAGCGNGLYRHYPGYNKAVFEIMPNSSSAGSVFELIADGKVITPVASGRNFVAVVPVEKNNTIVCCTVKKAGKTVVDRQEIAKIKVRKWKWQNHNYGKERVLLEPFTKIRKVGDNGIATLRGEYSFAPSGLPGKILADGIEICAASPVVEMVVDGKLIRFDRGSVKTVIAPDGLDAETVAEAAAGGIRLQSSIHSEYDNYNVHTMRLFGIKGKKISRWTLRFPFKESEAWLFHAVSNMIRRNPAGRIPDGVGCVWDGSKLFRTTAFGQETLHPAFVPYIWLGGIERGLAWFADSSLGMKLDRQKKAVRVVRSKGMVTLEIDLINRPVTLADGHKVEFGTQATPVKPIDQRIVNLTFDALGVGVPERPNELTISEHILGYPYRWSKVPVEEDWTLFDQLVKAADSADKSCVVPAVEAFMKKYSAKIRKMYVSAKAQEAYIKKMENSRATWIKLNFGSKRRSMPAKYSDPRLAYTADEETRYFQAEWFNPSVQNYLGALRTTLTPSYMDFILYGYAMEFEHGIKGCYLDDTFIMPEINPHTTAAVDDEGEVHANTGLFAMRELVRRIAVMQHLKGHSPRVLQVHMTNAQLIPVFSFATSQLGWEADFGEKPLQLRYKEDLILTESTGLQIGNAPLALGGVVRRTTPQAQWKSKFDYLTRTLLAMTMPYGVGVKLRASPQDASRKVVLAAQSALGKFGIGDKECVFEPFFDAAKAPKEISGKDLMISAYRRPGRKLIIIGNRGQTAQNFVINGKFRVVRDFETGKILEESDRTVKGYDFRLIELEF